LRIRVRNFGPIEKADIETKSLTILIGKNNQGKSYSAELIFALLKLGLLLALPGWSVRQKGKDSLVVTVSLRGYRVEPTYITRLLPEERERSLITFKRSDFDRYTDHELAKQIVDTFVSVLISIAENYLPRLLEETFGIDINTLVNVNSLSSNIHFDFSKYMSISMTISSKGKISVKKQNQEKELGELRDKVVPYVRKIRSHFDGMLRKKGEHAPFPAPIFDILGFLIEKVTREWDRDIIYIPAGRAGLFEGYYSVASALTRLTSVAPGRGITMPPMPPTASEFYNLMLQFRGKTGTMNQISSELARDIIDGEIVLERENKQQGMARIKYRFSKKSPRGTVDVIHAGSMIKELTGLYLAIQERIKSGTHLIVEEPEAHLHPSAQKRLARILMKLAANGVNILITTHSDIILRKIAHLVGQRQRTKSKDILPTNKISVTLLKEGEKGSSSEELKIPPSGILEGIPTFDEVITELYEEEISLESQLLKGE